MIGYYSYPEYERRLKAFLEKGIPRSEAKFIVDRMEIREFWDSQRIYDDENQFWFEEQEDEDCP